MTTRRRWTSEWDFSWPPNVQLATARLHPRGAVVVGARSNVELYEFFDIGAVVYFLRKVIWTVPDFSVDRYWDRLRELHRRIEDEGSFVSHSARVLVEARKPA